VCVLVAANEPIGPGDRFVGRPRDPGANPPARIAVVSKTDVAGPDAVAAQLSLLATGELGVFDAYVPLSARKGRRARSAWWASLESRLPEGPSYYPPGRP